MKKVVLGIIILAFIIGGGLGGLLLSVAQNMQAINNENILILVLDETNGNEVELGFGILTKVVEKEPFLIDPRTGVDGNVLRDSFTSGTYETNCKFLLGRELSGRYIARGVDESQRGFEGFQRVITVPISSLGKLIGPLEGIDFKFGEAGEMLITRRLTAGEVVMVLRTDDLSRTGTWRISSMDPRTGVPITREIDGVELLNFLLFVPFIEDEEHALLITKLMVLKGAMESLAERSNKDPVFFEKSLGSLIGDYKEGHIRTCPSNTVTQLIKYVPIEVSTRIITSLSRGIIG
jgi:hypothetical protein